jgi:hypothetical protein
VKLQVEQWDRAHRTVRTASNDAGRRLGSRPLQPAVRRGLVASGGVWSAQCRTYSVEWARTPELQRQSTCCLWPRLVRES